MAAVDLRQRMDRMVASWLPDRERRHLLQFYVAPPMGYRTRLVCAAGLILTGLGLQLVWLGDSTVLMLICSLPILLAGNVFLLVRGYNLQPSCPSAQGEWQKTTRDRFAKARRLEEQVQTWDETFADLTCVMGGVSLLWLVGVVVVVGLLLWSQLATRYWAPAVVADTAVLILPHWVTGVRRGWRPVALRQQIDALETALRTIAAYKEPPCQIQPMFETIGAGAKRAPIGARVFVRFPDGPQEFLGLQFQVALNNVQGTNYPYLYAVIVARESFGLLEGYLEQIRRQLKPKQKRQRGILQFLTAESPRVLTVESSREADVEVIVIRQHTTKDSGYHTEPPAIRHIAASAWESAAHVLKTAAGTRTSTG